MSHYFILLTQMKFNRKIYWLWWEDVNICHEWGTFSIFSMTHSVQNTLEGISYLHSIMVATRMLIVKSLMIQQRQVPLQRLCQVWIPVPFDAASKAMILDVETSKYPMSSTKQKSHCLQRDFHRTQLLQNFSPHPFTKYLLPFSNHCNPWAFPTSFNSAVSLDSSCHWEEEE